MFDYNLAQLITYAFNQPAKMPKADDVYGILKEKTDDVPVNNEQSNELTEYNMETDRAILLQRTAIIQNVKEKEEQADGGE